MTKIAFNKTQTTDLALKRTQEAIEQSLAPLLQSPLASNVILTDIQLVAGQDNFVNHGLGVAPTGYLVIRRNAATLVYDSSTTNDHPERRLILNVTNNVTVTLVVF